MELKGESKKEGSNMEMIDDGDIEYLGGLMEKMFRPLSDYPSFVSSQSQDKDSLPLNDMVEEEKGINEEDFDKEAPYHDEFFEYMNRDVNISLNVSAQKRGE